MLVVKAELWPAGSGAGKRTLGTLHIVNESQLADVSDYRVIAMEVANELTGEPAGIAEFKLRAHERRQRVWALLRRACAEAMTAGWPSPVPTSGLPRPDPRCKQAGPPAIPVSDLARHRSAGPDAGPEGSSMLMITIGLLPGGFESLRRRVAAMSIVNESDLADVSDYRVTAMESANPLTGTAPGFTYASVAAHDRRQRVWSLLRKACEEIDRARWISLEPGGTGQI
jgi:hypothetical protein